MIGLDFKKNNVVNIEPNCVFYTSEHNQHYAPMAHIGFKHLEEKHAEIVAQNEGHILEIGFGLHCSADKFISSNIESYTCIEINNILYQKALEWAQDKPNVTIINGAWESVIPTLTEKYDGIYYSPLEVNYSEFFNTCKLVSKTGTIMSAQGVIMSEPDLAQFNIEDNVTYPHLFDSIFTEQNYNALVEAGYFKVYWQYFDGTDFVKSL